LGFAPLGYVRQHSRRAAEDEAVVEQRLADHRRNPSSAVPLDEMKARLRSRFGSG